jgi:hypothetical protein
MISQRVLTISARKTTDLTLRIKLGELHPSSAGIGHRPNSNTLNLSVAVRSTATQHVGGVNLGNLVKELSGVGVVIVRKVSLG